MLKLVKLVFQYLAHQLLRSTLLVLVIYDLINSNIFHYNELMPLKMLFSSAT